MFHIVLNSDENYIKYASVLLYSIVSATACTQKINHNKESNYDGGGGIIENIFFIS